MTAWLWAFAVVVGAFSGCDREARPAPALAATGVPPSALAYERIVGGNQDLYVAAAEGGPESRLTDDPAVDGLPRWTRDGKSVIFSSNRSGQWQVWEVAAEGGEARRVRSTAAREWQADESPGGRQLAFLSNRQGAECLWLMDRGSGAARSLVCHGRRTVFGNPHWSADGRRIVFSSNWRTGHHIYVVDVATGEQERVSPLLSGGCEPRFSPDGRKVVYVGRGHLSKVSRLVERDLATGEEKILVGWPAMNYDPVYSPDGSEIAFASAITGEYAIYRQRLADGKSWRVTFGPGPARYPDYRPSTTGHPDGLRR